MRTLLLLRACQGAGKSTFIKENKLEPYTICPDDIRLMFQNPIRDVNGNLCISQENNKEVWELVYRFLEHRMERGDFTVIDATHATPSSVKKYKEMANKYKYNIYYYQFDVELEECLKRNRERENYKYVPEDVIIKTYNNIKSSDLGNIKRIYSLDEIDNFYIDNASDKYDEVKVIGDVHGCHTALKEVIKDYNEKGNTLWVFLGDYLDRGIENKQVLSTMMYLSKQKNVVLLEGNHDRYLKHFGYEEEIKSKEFLNLTLPQLIENMTSKELKEFKKDIRTFYKRLRQAYSFEFNGNKYLCTHAGLLEVPKLTYMSTVDLIKGIGDYVTPISELYEENYKLGKCQDFIQIFGHRNNNSTEHSINLEGEVEFGGDLKYVEITKDGVIRKSVKNTVFDKEYLDRRLDGITQYKGIKLTDNREINKLIISKLTKVRLVEPNMYSINFTENTFKKKLWNDISIKARGLFVDRITGEVKMRAFDKFFNENERTETKLEVLKDTLKYPLKVEQKENGYLGIVSVVKEDFVYSTKTSTNNDNIYTQELKRIFNLINEESRDKIYDICRVHNCSFVFEVISKLDPHIIEYQADKLVLLTVVKNSFETKYLNKFMDDDSLYDSVLHKVKVETYINNSEELIEYIETNKVNREDIEGVVITDCNNFKFKVKFNYYNKWKYARDLVNKYLKSVPKTFDTDTITISEVKEFMDWIINDLSYDFVKSSNIIELRNMYYKHKTK